MDKIGIKICDVNISVHGIKIIRAETNMSISEIKRKVSQNAYIVECDAVDEDGLELIIRLFKELTIEGIPCKLYEHGRLCSIDFFINLTKMYSEIATELDELIDNEENDET